jgi:hypothetical protein
MSGNLREKLTIRKARFSFFPPTQKNAAQIERAKEKRRLYKHKPDRSHPTLVQRRNSAVRVQAFADTGAIAKKVLEVYASRMRHRLGMHQRANR